MDVQLDYEGSFINLLLNIWNVAITNYGDNYPANESLLYGQVQFNVNEIYWSKCCLIFIESPLKRNWHSANFESNERIG